MEFKVIQAFHRWEAGDELSAQSWKQNDKPQKLEEGEEGISRLRKWNAQVLWITIS